MEYIIAKHGGGRLALGPAHPDFAQYLYWFHFANGNLQPNMGRNMVLRRLNLAPDNPVQSVFGTARVNVPSRQLVVDSKGTAYNITLSGLSVIPLTSSGTSKPGSRIPPNLRRRDSRTSPICCCC